MNETIDLLNMNGLELKKTSDKNNGEYRGPCPYCEEGRDRFVVTPNPESAPYGMFYCRQCKNGGKVPDLITFLGGDVSALPENDLYKGGQYKSSKRHPDTSLQKTPPDEKWQNICRKTMKNVFSKNPDKTEAFQTRGISMATVKELGLGYNKKSTPIAIDGEVSNIPEGMVIPNYRANTLYSLQIRSWITGSRYQYFKGSVQVPYHTTKLDKLEAPIVIVESALDAIILYQEAGDLVHAIAMGSAQNKPDAYLKALMSKATDTFVCMDYDNAGFEAAKWWKDKFPAVKIGFIPKGKDVGDYHIEGGPVRNWVEALITNDTVPERPQPKIDLYIIDEKEDAEGLVNSIRASEAVPGVSISENYLGIAVGDQTFAIDLHKVPPECPVLMEDMAVVAHDGVDFLEKLSKYNLTCGHTESTRLQHLIISEMLWDHEKLAQHRLGFGSGYFAGEQAQTALAAYINWEIYQLQEEILKKNNLEKAYQLYAGAQPALAEIRMTGLCIDIEKQHDTYTKWENTANNVDPESKRYRSLKSHIEQHGEKYKTLYDKETGRLYANLNFNESPTGRLSTTGINFLAVPKNEIRETYYAPEGKTFIGGDFCQLEMLVGALASNDDTMVEAFKNGADFHRLTAAVISGIEENAVTKEQRQAAKAFNYEVIYGGSRKRVKEIKKHLSKKYPIFYGWIDHQAENAGHTRHIYTPAGKRITRQEIFSKWKKQACNFPIQGGASEIMFATLAKLHIALKDLDAKIVLCIHDEIIIEAAQQDAEAAKNVLVSTMEQGLLEIFPEAPTNGLVKLKQGNTWADIT